MESVVTEVDHLPRWEARRGTIAQVELIEFIRQMATLVEAGFVPAEACSILAERKKDGRLRFLLEAICKEMDMGRSLADAVEIHVGVFSANDLDALRSAERDGAVAPCLDQLGAQLARGWRFTQGIAAASRLPWQRTSVALAALILLIVGIYQ